MLREISSGRGEGPSYMKVPYIESSFQVTSIHHCAVFGIEECSGSEERYENVFVCICTSVCMHVLSRSSKILYGTPEEEECIENSLFWYLETLEKGLNLDKK